MIYNTRNPSNGTAESQKEKKTCVNVHFSTVRHMDKNCLIKLFKNCLTVLSFPLKSRVFRPIAIT